MIRAIVVMGVSGSGKSTLARALADALGWAFVEGDDLHPPANIAKMAAGICGLFNTNSPCPLGYTTAGSTRAASTLAGT